MTTAAAWEASPDRLPSDVSAVLDSSRDESLLGLRLLAAIPEWEVPLEGGDTASRTDVLALCSNQYGLCVVAVEGKVDEDFGPLLGKKRADATPGVNTRLESLQEILKHSSFDDSIRYQFLHRTASALLTAREFHARTAVMVVQSFGSKTSLREDFNNFCQALGATEIEAGLYLAKSFDAPRLFLVWCDGDKKFLQVDLPSTY